MAISENNAEQFDPTFGEMLSFFWKRKILFLIITCVTTLLLIVTALVYNALAARLELEFHLSFKTFETGILPNGLPFDMQQFISLDVVTQIIDDTDELSNLSPTEIIQSLEINDTTISVALRYFSSDEVASLFLNEILDNMLSVVLVSDEMIVVYNEIDRLLNNDALDFVDIVERLQAQIGNIIFIYEDLLARDYTLGLKDGLSVLQHYANLFTYDPIRVGQDLVASASVLEIVRNQYVIDAAPDRLDVANMQLTENNKQLADLQAIMDLIGPNLVLTNQMDQLIFENRSINSHIRYLERVINHSTLATEEFMGSFNEFLNNISTHTNTVNYFNRVRINNDTIFILNNTAGEIINTFSIWLFALGGVLVGAVIAAITISVIEKRKRST